MKTGELEVLSLRWLAAHNCAEQARAEEDQLWEQLCAARNDKAFGEMSSSKKQVKVESVLFVSNCGCIRRDVQLTVGSADEAPGKLPNFSCVGHDNYQLYFESGRWVYVHPAMLNSQAEIRIRVRTFYKL